MNLEDRIDEMYEKQGLADGGDIVPGITGRTPGAKEFMEYQKPFIKQLISEVVEYVKPEKYYSKNELMEGPFNRDEDLIRMGNRSAIAEMEQKIKELGLMPKEEEE